MPAGNQILLSEVPSSSFNGERATDYDEVIGGGGSSNADMEGSLADMERQIKEKMLAKEQKMREFEQRRRLDLMSCSSSSSSCMTIPPSGTDHSTIDK